MPARPRPERKRRPEHDGQRERGSGDKIDRRRGAHVEPRDRDHQQMSARQAQREPNSVPRMPSNRASRSSMPHDLPASRAHGPQDRRSAGAAR